MRNSFQDCEYHDVAGAAFFLALKICEDYRKLSHVVEICMQKAMKKEGLVVDETSKVSAKINCEWNEELLFCLRFSFFFTFIIMYISWSLQ